MPDTAMQTWIHLAEDAGFSHACSLDVASLSPIPEVRDACAANKCGKYNACWTCPPGCGTLQDCALRMRSYSTGLIVQTVGTLEDSLDYASMLSVEARHKKTFSAFAETLRASFPDVLALGSGGCTFCKICAYPDAPCRFPEKAYSSMEANGLLVTDVCRSNGLSYYYGPNTIAYTGCYLWNKRNP